MIRRLFAFIGLAVSFVAWASPATSEIGTCAYYQTLSASLGCSPSGYLLSFGYPYCQKFVDQEPFYPASGRAVLDRIRTCLETTLENTPALNCQNVETIAPQSHVSCYVQSGFCQLDVLEQAVIAITIAPSLLGNSGLEMTAVQVQDLCLQSDIQSL